MGTDARPSASEIDIVNSAVPVSVLLVPISAASSAQSSRILQLLSQQLSEDRGDGHTFAIDSFISSLAGF